MEENSNALDQRKGGYFINQYPRKYHTLKLCSFSSQFAINCRGNSIAFTQEQLIVVMVHGGMVPNRWMDGAPF